MTKRIFLLIVIVLVSFALCYAKDLISREAFSYFDEAAMTQRAGDFKKAGFACRKVELLDSNNKNWQKFSNNNYAVMYMQQENLRRAGEAIKAALKIDPNYKAAHLHPGLIYDRYGDKYTAMKYPLQALNMDLEKQKPKNFILEERKRPKR